ncbi:alternative ribosome rescue aminoacyl-tRNA hydrolase ArfB [Ramlibacter alkalitolerans]|uniref:Aminoacyl-tRNA hydrolase n=1 Tax=Ramlibacter alkalitolerans TaxID=2039631 RepID=A0ABS1JV73_9BURK|nr:alternative ribosome rescue aminoacyl-tRNA hydrolase ArfB [Ramlibacter alkalitolerans]MBL0428114.1 aminoacyl-tRNA hydrolase [Ramlibacter alkalitolerans]
MPLVREDEVVFEAMRAQGPGGQNVNKVSSAVQLRFDIRASSLPPHVKERLLGLPGRRVNKDGVLVLKAQTTRSQDQNKALALQRLEEIVAEAAVVPEIRRPTKPTYGSKQRRLEGKAIRAEVKAGRRKVED